MKKLLILLLCFANTAYAQEVIVGFDTKTDLPVLNEELRSINVEAQQLETRIETLEDNQYTPSVSNVLAGSILQTVETIETDYADLGSTNVVLDDSVMTSSEGNTFADLNTTITPNSASNILEIEVFIFVSLSSASGVGCAAGLFQDAGASSIAAAEVLASDSYVTLLHIPPYRMVAGTASATTFKVRVGSVGGRNTYINGYSGTRHFGGSLKTRMTIKEIKV